MRKKVLKSILYINIYNIVYVSKIFAVSGLEKAKKL